jgi:hypothetical protein
MTNIILKLNKMTRLILRAVLIGILVGVAAFFVPHLLLGIIILCFVVRLSHCGRMTHGCHGYRHEERLFYMADKIRSMSEEEYAEFKTKMSGGGCGYHHHHSHCCCKSKKEESAQ